MTALPHWDLEPLAPSLDTQAAINRALDEAAADVDAFAQRYRGGVAELSADGLVEALESIEDLYTRIYRPSAYSSLAFSVATSEPDVQALRSKVGERVTDLSNRLRFLDIEIKTAPQPAVDAWLASAALERYRHFIRTRRKLAPHTLSEAEEALDATKAITGAQAWSRLYTEVSSAWRFEIDVDGSRTPRSLAEIRALRSHCNRDVRKAATVALLERFADNGQVLTFAVNTIYQDHRLSTKMRRYDSLIGPTALSDELTPEVIEALMQAVEGAYPLAHRYYRIKSRALGLDDFGSHDLLAPWEDEPPKIPWADARESVLEAFDTVTPMFGELARRFFDEHRIDAEPRAGKRDGAFCAGMMPGVPPFVLVNYTGRVDDVATLAHELGHGVHFALAQTEQTLLTYDPTTPMAETASVFGETVLIEKLLAEQSDPKIRRSILASRIEDTMATIMRQVAYTRYELNAHARCAEGITTADELGALWLTEMGRLYGDSVKMSDADKWGWLSIPHLVHYRFYCYSYAFGMLLVLALYKKWQAEGDAFVPRYLKLLSSGGSDDPHALLAPLGIDISDPDFWKGGLDLIARSIDDFEAVAAG